MAVPVYSITRAEIDEFWRRKEMEEEEQLLTAEKEAARIKAKTLKIEDCMLFEQMIRDILEGNEGDRTRKMERDITKNSRMIAAATNNTEARIGIKHWWKRSAYAYLNEPALTSMDESGRRKHTITHLPRGRCIEIRLSTPRQANNSNSVIFKLFMPRISCDM